MNAINTETDSNAVPPRRRALPRRLSSLSSRPTDRDVDSLRTASCSCVTARSWPEGWWAPYAPERPHVLYSMSKSFTSSAVGLAVAEGLRTVDDRVLSFFPDRPRLR